MVSELSSVVRVCNVLGDTRSSAESSLMDFWEKGLPGAISSTSFCFFCLRLYMTKAIEANDPMMVIVIATAMPATAPFDRPEDEFSSSDESDASAGCVSEVSECVK